MKKAWFLMITLVRLVFGFIEEKERRKEHEEDRNRNKEDEKEDIKED